MFGNKMNAVEKAIKKQHVNTLIELSRDKDKNVSMAAIDGMATIGNDDAAHYLVILLQSPQADMRLAAANALGTIKNKHTKAFLSAQLQKEEEPEVEQAIRHAMVQIKEY